MVMPYTLLLVVGLLFGADGSQAAQPDVKTAVKDVGRKVVVKLEDATITLTVNGTFRIHPVKTAQGTRLMLETGGITIDAVRMGVESNGEAHEVYINETGEMKVIGRSLPAGR